MLERGVRTLPPPPSSAQIPPRGRPGGSEDRPRQISGRSADDVFCLAGSLVASLAAVWLLYERVFAFSGNVGFILSWYLVFLVLYAVVSSASNPRTIVVDRLGSAVVHGAVGVVALVLVTTVLFIFMKGWPALRHVNFYTQDMSGVRPTSPLGQGGVLHVVAGSAIEVSIAVAIAVPLAIGAAVFMTEFSGRVANTVRVVVEAMSALPDILAGLFIYSFLVIGFHMEKGGLAVSLALAVTMLPVMARSAEVVLRLVPRGLREAGLALGAPRWQTVRQVVLPTARSGLATSLILGVARVCGETAPLLIVTGASTFFNANPLHNPMNSLPLFVYTAITSGEPLYVQRGYGAASLLISLVLVLFVITRLVARNRKDAR